MPEAQVETSNETVDTQEIAKFSAMAAEWWDPHGKFRPLHKFNPTRLKYIREQVSTHFSRDEQVQKPLEGLRLLDIGCGGGLLSEPMPRLGAKVTGADAGEKNIKTASVHAAEQGLKIDYRHTTAEALAQAGEQFDVILNMEVIEHVADTQAFMTSCAGCLRPGGLMIVATLNRTAKAFALAIVGAEYVLGWLPRGTHEWNKFITLDEMRTMMENADLLPGQLTGVSFNPLSDKWSVSGDTAVNYMMTATRPA
ncbi:MAG: bifunctional 2-polyprenyl-6-hydroxyphenol methylase/3-demethylubiquinol 3-O-methyltransferase UbiG [Candidatus Phaeomarinobacter sp.]